MSYRGSLHVLLAALVALGFAGCMDRSLPEDPTSTMDIRDEFAKAITDGDLAKVTEMLTMEPLLLNEPHPTGMQYPLHIAAAVNNEEIIKYLLEQGADPYAQNDEGEYAVDKARFAGASDEIIALLGAGQ